MSAKTELRKARVARGLCCYCPNKVLPGRSCCRKCINYQRQYQQKYKKGREDRGTCTVCGKPRDNEFKSCSSCLTKKRHYLFNLRMECISAYGGPKCACCAESTLEFLQIDHVHGDGSDHRRSVGVGVQFYLWLRRNKFPKGFQILCANCNSAKGFYGFCPHHPEKILNPEVYARTRR